MSDFDTKVEEFRTKLEGFLADYKRAHYPSLTLPTVELMRGGKYVRVVVKDPHASAYAFISTLNGDILKPAGWKGPAKWARGNIFNADPLKGCGPHGVDYLR